MSEPTHYITATWESGYGPSYRMKCTAPERAACHAVFTCDCEHWYGMDIAGGKPTHTAHTYDDNDEPIDIEHVGEFKVESCNYGDWFGEIGAEAIVGEVTFAVRPEWEDEGYDFHIDRITETAVTP